MSIYLKKNNLNSQQKAIVHKKEESEKQRRREYEKNKSEKTRGEFVMKKCEEIESVIKENEVEILEFIQNSDVDFECLESSKVFSVMFNLTTKECRCIFDDYNVITTGNEEVVVYSIGVGDIGFMAEESFIDDHGKGDYMHNYFREYLENIINLDYEFIQNSWLKGRKVYTI